MTMLKVDAGLHYGPHHCYGRPQQRHHRQALQPQLHVHACVVVLCMAALYNACFRNVPPAAGLYRNSMANVQRFLKQRHGHSYCVYNLCSEEAYTYKPQSFERVANFPFDDHQACMAQ